MGYDGGRLKDEIRKFFSETLNDILKLEENSTYGRPDDLSLKEIHVIEAAANAMRDGAPARASDIAAELKVTPGTLTAAADSLEKKGYVLRTRDIDDKRGVRVVLTARGVGAREQHAAYHAELADKIVSYLGAREGDIDPRPLIDFMEAARAVCLKKEPPKHEVKILADSACDLGTEEAARLGVTLLPMNILFGETAYRQDVDMSAARFYELLSESKEQPITSQLTPFILERAYREITHGGGEAVAIHLASALSGTYQSAVLAARETPGVYTVDSKSATLGASLLVREAVKLRDAGTGAAEIARRIAALGERLVMLAYIPTLKYLVRGGRLSATAGVVGSALNIYPIISVRDGAVKSVGKARGKNAACAEIARMIKKEGVDNAHGVVFGHAAARDDIARLQDALAELVGGCEISYCEIGAVIGAHSGPGAVGVAFIKRADE